MADDGREPRPGPGRVTGWIFGLASSLAVLAGCASQVPPPGGPEDKEPPVIVATEPAPGGLNVREGRFSVEFSEYVDRRSFQESAFLSPSAGALKFDWSGTTVGIEAAETLRASTTYILTIGTDLKDSRGNRMEESFTLPFSTGSAIDSCSVSGLVDDPEPAGVMVFAFDVAGGRGDTLDPRAVKPDYLTQTGKDGTFLLRNLREGEYRLMAVRDAFKNLLYDVQTDRYGMASSDVRLGGETRTASGFGFRLTAEDTLRPFLSGARAKNAASIVLRFNEPVVVPGGTASVTIVDTLAGAALAAAAITPLDTSGREFLVVTSRQDSGATYRVTLAAFADLRGNEADSAGRSAVFGGGAGADTVPPVLAMNVARDSSTGFLPLDTLRLTFSEPVDTGVFAAGFTLTGGGGAPVDGSLRWSGSGFARFFAAEPFPPGRWFSVAVRLDSIVGLTGARGRDSLLVRRFRVAEERELAGISGTVRLEGGADGAIVVEARNLSGSGAGIQRVLTDSSGAFRIEPLPEGRYVLSAFQDRNGNGVHDCGYPHPVGFSEPFGLFPDTLRLRPRWPVEGVRIEIGR